MLLDKSTNINVNRKDKFNNTALYAACCHGNTALVNLLIEHGAEVNTKNDDGYTPLYRVCKRGNLDMVNLLIEHKANVNEKGNEDRTALLIACEEGHFKIIQRLLEEEADVNAVSKDMKWSPLFMAIGQGSLEIVKLLVNYKANTNQLDSMNRSPLCMAILKRQFSIAIYLLI
eukprot:CAMPEP_0117426514 /NCGR_PEP_ID=MMETSP0758-20121206/6602_1 /TAXON_ID=63605 /ORGANISM="Percolomonas cosmopolitus, Strain AE-1 (ATCC 50343)" /LENGTH=172 /DNA_ID=CAMNT_0005211707 /DNA_START=520 /DNA_END=1035 /DNA_ORIENTATION=+